MEMGAEASRIAIEPEGRRIVISGVVDSHTVPELVEAFESFGANGNVELDLSAVEFIDSSGLRALVNMHRHLEEAGHQLRIETVSEPVGRLLELTGLADHLHLQ
jgi:anti-sigma B factor antagonist